jgi:hypothetical protein
MKLTTGAEARSFCATLNAGLEGPLFHGRSTPVAIAGLQELDATLVIWTT